MYVYVCCLESDSEVAEELLKPGHLSRLLEEDLSGDVSSLSLSDVVGVTEKLLERLRSHRDACPPQHLGVRFCCIKTFHIPSRVHDTVMLNYCVCMCVGAEGGLQVSGTFRTHAVCVLGAGALVRGGVYGHSPQHRQTAVRPRLSLH